MQGTVLYGPRDVRFEERDAPKIVEPTDAIIRISATCVCGSDLWPYRGIQPVNEPTPMGHEYCGIVEEVGSAVRSVRPGQFVIGSFFASDNTCPVCQHGYQSSCLHRRVRRRRAGAPAARPARGRHPGGHAGCAPGRPDPEPADDLGRPGHRLVRCRRGQREAGSDGRGRRRRCGRPPRRALRQADGCGADHRDEPSRDAAEARARVRRDRHRDRARRRGRRPHQGSDQGHRRRLGAGVRRHPGVDAAGDPCRPSGRVRGLRRRPARGRRSTARSCSSRTSTCTAAPRRCATTCPS